MAKRLENFGIFEVEPTKGYQSAISELESFEMIEFINPFTMIYDSIPIYMLDRFIVQFYSYESQSLIDSLIVAYHLEIIDSIPEAAGEYIFRITKQTGYSIDEISNIFYNMDCTAFSHPDFLCRAESCAYPVYDAFYPYQTNIRKSIGYSDHVNSCWEITNGDSNISVAVIDEGFEAHEDLDSNLTLAGYDFLNDDTIPEPVDDTFSVHGMICAGLIFAMHNNFVPDYPPTDGDKGMTSIVGMAPRCKFLPIKHDWYQGALLSSSAEEAIRFAVDNNAAVINYSWGISGNLDNLEAIIDSAYYYGRNGLGTIIVFAAGNGIICPIYPPADRSTVLAVAALWDNDVWWSLSCRGDSLDLVATGADVWTWDRMDSLGYNPLYMEPPYDPQFCTPINRVHYLCHVSGTSVAAPLVAGAAALVLSRRPDLTAAEVFDVLKYSADTLLYDTVHPPDPQYGYGRVNAFKALLAVCRGDANNDGTVNILDHSYLINYLYLGGPAPYPDVLMGDANCDGIVNIYDITYIYTYLYFGGDEPPICFEYNE